MNDASTLPKAAPSIFDGWNDTVRAIIRAARGLKPDVAVELPSVGEGKYIRYALDKDGQLSYGKPKGVRRLPRKRNQGVLVAVQGELMVRRLSKIFAAVAMDAEARKAEGQEAPPMPQITSEQLAEAARYAEKRAPHVLAIDFKLKRKAARQRQQASRRINAGVVQHARAAHTAA